MDDVVLFVDDEEYILNSLKRLFPRTGDFTIKTAKNGDEAIEIIKKEKISMILTDNLMPGISGVDLLVKVKTLAPCTVGVLMTAHANLVTALDGINRGEIFKFIIKPWDNNFLIEVVNNAVKRHHMLKSLHQTTKDVDQLKNNLLNNMAHEFRTPMIGVIGMIELMLGTPLTDEQRKFIDIMYNAADAQMLLIDDVLDFSMLKAGKLNLVNISFDFKEIIKNLLDELALQADVKKLAFKYVITEDVPDTITGDPVILSKVIKKFVENAIKFTDKGEIDVCINTEKDSQSAVLIRFEVKDTGRGISVDEEVDIFHAFTQEDSSPTRRYEGLGLGLTIAKQCVELMNGNIGFNRLKSGCAFWFTIPLKSR